MRLGVAITLSVRKERFAMKVYLGSWTLPSGNSCDVSVNQDTSGNIHVWFAWDSPPPFRTEDEAYYQSVVVPEVAARSLHLKETWLGSAKEGEQA